MEKKEKFYTPLDAQRPFNESSVVHFPHWGKWGKGGRGGNPLCTPLGCVCRLARSFVWLLNGVGVRKGRTLSNWQPQNSCIDLDALFKLRPKKSFFGVSENLLPCLSVCVYFFFLVSRPGYLGQARTEKEEEEEERKDKP